MAVIEVDFNGADEYVGQAQAKPSVKVPPGRYAAKLASTYVTKSKNAEENTLIIWRFAVTEPGPYLAEEVPYFTSLVDNRKLDNGQPDDVAKKQAAARLVDFLNRMNIPYDRSKGCIDTDAALGTNATIEVINRGDSPQVQSVYPA